MTHLANSYAGLGRPTDALKLREQTLALQKRILGPGDPGTLNSMSNLANSYTSLHRYDDAVALHLQTLALRKSYLGPEHPDTVRTMSNLANCYSLLDRNAEALPIREAALAFRKVHLGLDHPDTLNSMWRVASNLILLGRSPEAVPIIDECIQRAKGRVVPPILIPDLVNLRLRHFEQAQDFTGCRATAQLWENLGRSDGDSFYQAGICRAVTAKLMQKALGADEAGLAKSEADQAITWFHKAIATGYKDVAKITRPEDFDALRDRADFHELKKNLEISAGKKLTAPISK